MAATRHFLLLALFVMLALGVLAPSSSATESRGAADPPAPSDLALAKSTPTDLTIEWSRPKGDDKVVVYEIYVGDVLTQKIDLKGKDVVGFKSTKEGFAYELGELKCGTSYSVGVVAVDRDGNRSARTVTIVATAQCVAATPASPPPPPPPPPASPPPSPPPPPASPPTKDNHGDKGGNGSNGGGNTPSTTPQTSPSAPTTSSSPTSPSTTSTTTSQAPATVLSPPSNLRLARATPTAVMLDWARPREPGKITGYEVFLDDALSGTTSRTDYFLSALTCGTSYPVGVDAFDRSGNRSVRATATVSTSACVDTTPPSQPTGFRQDFTTSSSAVLAWNPSTDNVGVVSYGIYSGGVLVASSSEARQALSGLACGQTYAYSIDAADAAGNRSTRGVATVWTASCTDTEPPTPPVPVSVTDATQSTVSVAWPVASDNVRVDHYNVHRGGTRIGETTTTTETVSSLACGTSYVIGVNAEDAAGNTSTMATTVAQTDACTTSTDTQPPTTPSGVAASTATQTSIAVRWNPSTDNVGVTGYTVYRDGTAAGNSASTSYTLTGLACGRSYLVGVDATDAAGNRSGRGESYLSTAACSDTTPPTQPTPVTMASRTQTSISVTWPASTDNVGVAGYGVYRAGTKLTEIAERAYTYAGLVCGTNYTLGVDAYDASGNRSAATTVIIATTACADVTPPTPPTALAASVVTQTSLTLAWTPSTDNVGVTRYDLQRNGTQAGSVTVPTSIQTGLTCGTSYAFAVVAVDAAGNRSTPAQLTSSSATCATGPTPTLQAIDGGVGYTAQFSNALPSTTDYFPVAVWGAYNQTQTNLGLDAAAGLNTYVWAADASYVPAIRSDGRFKVIQDEGNRTNAGSETAGWLLGDEIDMCCGPPNYAGGNGYEMLESAAASLPADGRFRFTNYGKGVLLWESDADAAKFINGRNGPNSMQQIVSADLYWFTDPNERGNPRYGFGSSYGDDVTRMRYLDSLDGIRMPVWAFVETGWPFTESAGQGGRSIQPAELRSAVWHALIAGARGIIYFQHSFGGPCIGDHHTTRSDCEGTRAMVTSVDAQIRALARVLNSPVVTSGHSATDTMNGNVRYAVKWSGSNVYVFAGADKGGGNATFSIPCVGNATAVVDGENRSIPVTNGSFTDSFADKNAVHIYRLDGGSTCGLT